MTTMEKNELRRLVREAKRNVPLDEKKYRSQGILHRVEDMRVFAEARTVLMYWSMDDEVYTHTFARKWYGMKTILLPCVEGDDLVIRRYEGDQSLRPGPQFGIPEPVGEPVDDMSRIDMIIVPGVAFDKSANRMGRGRGFYDRLLRSTSNAVKTGVAFDFQIFDSIPVDTHDVPMDMVVCESAIYNRQS